MYRNDQTKVRPTICSESLIFRGHKVAIPELTSKPLAHFKRPNFNSFLQSEIQDG